MEGKPRHFSAQLIYGRPQRGMSFLEKRPLHFFDCYRLECARISPGGPSASIGEESQGEGAARFTPGFCGTLATLHSTAAVAAAYWTGSLVAAAAVEVWAREVWDR